MFELSQFCFVKFVSVVAEYIYVRVIVSFLT